MENVISNWPTLLLVIFLSIFVVLILYTFWFNRKAERALHKYAISQGWLFTKKPPQESFPSDFDALPYRKNYGKVFHQVEFCYEDHQGIRIMTSRFLLPLPSDIPRGLVRFSFAAPLVIVANHFFPGRIGFKPFALEWEFSSGIMKSSNDSLATWECYSDEQLPHAIIYTDVPIHFDRIIKIISDEMIQFSRFCRPQEVTYEFVPGFLLISAPNTMAEKIDKLYPTVSKLSARLNRLWS